MLYDDTINVILCLRVFFCFNGFNRFTWFNRGRITKNDGCTFLVVTVKRWLKSVYIYGSYRKIKTEVPLFWTTLYLLLPCWYYVHASITADILE